ncbi:phosphoketolase [Diplocarpon rosae]|nr:phosphoketolase [Diplocarpon rosae]
MASAAGDVAIKSISPYGLARSTVAGKPLSAEEIRKYDAYFRAKTPGSIHEGGELGYSISHAFGTVFDHPNLITITMAMAATLEKAVVEIRGYQKQARDSGQAFRPRWPMIVLRSPKGWSAPRKIDGKLLEGFWRSHQIPIPDGLGIWDWASNDQGEDPDVVMACCGDVPTLEALAATALLREFLPTLKIRFVNIAAKTTAYENGIDPAYVTGWRWPYPRA